MLLTSRRQLLGEGRTLAENRSLPVDDVDRDDEEAGDTSQDG